MKISTIIIAALLIAGCGLAAYRTAGNTQLYKIQQSIPTNSPLPPPPAPIQAPVTHPDQITIREGETVTTPGGRQIDNKFNQITKQLFKAAMAFVVPDNAAVGQSIKAQLLIDPESDAERLTGQLTKPGQKTSGSITVSRVVKASIVAPEFTVVPVTEEEQAIIGGKSTEWLWTLTPKRSGTHDINLTVTAILKVDGRESKHQLKTFEKQIQIKVKPGQVILDWFKSYWQWLTTTLVLPLILWLWRRRREAD